MTPPDNTLTLEQWAKVRELLSLWLADPDADLEAAVAFCKQYLASLPWKIDLTSSTVPWMVAGAYRREHPSKLDRCTLALSNYRETRRTPWR